MAKGFDAPPTLERSGSEHRRAVTSPLPEVSVPPLTGGTEGGEKTIERGLGRKWSSPCRRDGEVENSAL